MRKTRLGFSATLDEPIVHSFSDTIVVKKEGEQGGETSGSLLLAETVFVEFLIRLSH